MTGWRVGWMVVPEPLVRLDRVVGATADPRPDDVPALLEVPEDRQHAALRHLRAAGLYAGLFPAAKDEADLAGFDPVEDDVFNEHLLPIPLEIRKYRWLLDPFRQFKSRFRLAVDTLIFVVYWKQ